MAELIESLDQAWDDESGFLGQLRCGEFDEVAGWGYVRTLKEIPRITEDFNPKIVTLIWFAPQFVEWQCERVAATEVELAKIRRVATGIHEAVADVLGIP